MVRSRSRRPLLTLALVAAATLFAGTGSAQAVMLSGSALDVGVGLDPGRDLDGVTRGAYLTDSPATVVVSVSDDAPPFECKMDMTTMGDD